MDVMSIVARATCIRAVFGGGGGGGGGGREKGYWPPR